MSVQCYLGDKWLTIFLTAIRLLRKIMFITVAMEQICSLPYSLYYLDILNCFSNITLHYVCVKGCIALHLRLITSGLGVLFLSVVTH